MRFDVIRFFVQNSPNILSTNKIISNLKTFFNSLWNLAWGLSLKLYLNVFFYFHLNNHRSQGMTRVQYFTNCDFCEKGHKSTKYDVLGMLKGPSH